MSLYDIGAMGSASLDDRYQFNFFNPPEGSYPTIDLMVTHVEDIGEFSGWPITKEAEMELSTITSSLSPIKREKLTEKPDFKTVYAALFIDNEVYRCRVLEFLSPETGSSDLVKVVYIDYGNKAELNWRQSLFVLPMHLQRLPCRSIRVVMTNIGRSVAESGSKLDELMTDWFADLLMNERVKVFKMNKEIRVVHDDVLVDDIYWHIRKQKSRCETAARKKIQEPLVVAPYIQANKAVVNGSSSCAGEKAQPEHDKIDNQKQKVGSSGPPSRSRSGSSHGRRSLINDFDKLSMCSTMSNDSLPPVGTVSGSASKNSTRYKFKRFSRKEPENRLSRSYEKAVLDDLNSASGRDAKSASRLSRSHEMASLVELKDSAIVAAKAATSSQVPSSTADILEPTKVVPTSRLLKAENQAWAESMKMEELVREFMDNSKLFIQTTPVKTVEVGAQEDGRLEVTPLRQDGVNAQSRVKPVRTTRLPPSMSPLPSKSLKTTLLTSPVSPDSSSTSNNLSSGGKTSHCDNVDDKKETKMSPVSDCMDLIYFDEAFQQQAKATYFGARRVLRLSEYILANHTSGAASSDALNDVESYVECLRLLDGGSEAKKASTKGMRDSLMVVVKDTIREELEATKPERLRKLFQKLEEELVLWRSIELSQSRLVRQASKDDVKAFSVINSLNEVLANFKDIIDKWPSCLVNSKAKSDNCIRRSPILRSRASISEESGIQCSEGNAGPVDAADTEKLVKDIIVMESSINLFVSEALDEMKKTLETKLIKVERFAEIIRALDQV